MFGTNKTIRMNKSGFIRGYEYILYFFGMVVAFAFIVGINDVLIEEMFKPANDIIMEGVLDYTTNDSDIYLAMQENSATTINRTLPFNIILMFMVVYLVMVSLIDVARERKVDPFELFYRTVGGIILLIFIIQIAIIKIIEYMNIQVLNYLFADILETQLPFYAIILDNWWLVILIWAGGLVLSNWFFGKETRN